MIIFFSALQPNALRNCELSDLSSGSPTPPNTSKRLYHSGSPTMPSIINWKITSKYKRLRSLSFIGFPVA